jgi:NTP pyrophosphatase (non-canonical NTP hydrolase)
MSPPKANVAPSALLPEPLSLPGLQSYVAKIVEERGFTRDLDRIFILLVEELGELAEEIAAGAGPKPPAIQSARQAGSLAGPDARIPVAESSQGLAAELADVTLYLVDLANGLEIDLDAALAGRPQGEAATAGGPSARGPLARAEPPGDASTVGPHAGPASLSERQAASARADPASAWLALVQGVGRLARHLRQRWARRDSGAAPALLAAALRAVLQLAGGYGVDLTRALREKETANAQRTWSY